MFIRTCSAVAICTLVVFGGGRADAADDAAPNPNAAAITANQQLQALVESQRDLLKAQKDLIDARYPQIAGGLEGSVKKGDSSLFSLGIYAEVARRIPIAAQRVCRRMGEVVADRNAGIGHLVIGGPTESQALLNYRVAERQLQSLVADAEALLPGTDNSAGVGARMVPIYGIGAAFTMLTSFTKLFRTERTIFEESSDIDEGWLVEQVFLCAPTAASRSLPRAALDSTVAALGDSDGSAFWQHFETLLDLRTKLAAVAASKLAADAARADAAGAMVGQIGSFADSVLGADAVSKRSALGLILLGELVQKELLREHAALVDVRLVKQAGMSMVTKALWREDRLYVSGGLIVGFRMTDRKGMLRASELVNEAEPQMHRVKLSQQPPGGLEP